MCHFSVFFGDLAVFLKLTKIFPGTWEFYLYILQVLILPNVMFTQIIEHRIPLILPGVLNIGPSWNS